MVRLALLSTLMPAAVAAVALLAALRLGPRVQKAAAAIAVVLGYGTAHVALLGLPPLLPVEASQWLPHLALAAAALAVAEILTPGARWRWPMRALLLVTAAACLLRPLTAYAWGIGEGSMRIAAAATLALGAWAGATAAARWLPTLPLGLLLTLGCSALSIACLLAHSASLAQLAGGVAAACGGVSAAALLAHGRLPLAPAVAVTLPLAAALGTSAAFYADLPRTAALLLTAAPVAAAAVARRGPWLGVTVAVALFAAAVAATAAL